jgi:hypothetical protein
MNKTLCLSIFFLNSLIAVDKIQKNVIISGTCKDVALEIPYTIKIIEKIANLFENYQIIIYENNSYDNTKIILNNWAKKNNKVKIISEDFDQEYLNSLIINKLIDPWFGMYSKTEILAMARNKLLKEIFKDNYSKFSHVIMMDLDFIIEPRYQAFSEIFSSNIKWDAVFANGIYYKDKRLHSDRYAFRDQEQPFGCELFGDKHLNYLRGVSFKFNDLWHPVISGFGGCAIYRKDSIKNCLYSGVVNQDLSKFIQNFIKKNKNHDFVRKYFGDLKKVNHYRYINSYDVKFKKFMDQDNGIIIKNFNDKLVWRMSDYVYSYPAVCEHVPFHCAMINRGYDKLFIVPNFLFYYSIRSIDKLNI